MKQYEVWYMRPEWFRNGIMGMEPDGESLEDTHVYLFTIKAANPDDAWMAMQGELWSPNGEAVGFLKSLGLKHTSMSVGDILVDTDGNELLIEGFGFKTL